MTAPIDIDFIAQLARLGISEAEKAKYAQQLQSILAHIAQLEELNVEGIEPTAHAFSIYNVYRDDVPGPTFTPEQALINAPKLPSGQRATHDDQWVVPVVVE